MGASDFVFVIAAIGLVQMVLGTYLAAEYGEAVASVALTLFGAFSVACALLALAA